ncbi:hypothetical protein [Lentzea sp.]|uniref:hypothetical protein n=1 Tax=Lentzea sp. TaxID=56099 RepID=UPI002BFB050B|nr:hypothetical protein [Lentzea sp.]HUQ59543.1 hypothetical protein [Lentzea sp.]
MTNALALQAAEKVEAVDRDLERFFDVVNATLTWVPPPLRPMIDQIEEDVRWLTGRIAEFRDRVSQVCRQTGDPDRLRQVGTGWVEQVGDVLGDIAGTLTLDKMRTNVEWEGRAARAYAAAVPPQPQGLTAVKDVANQMRASLNTLANSIDAFWISMIVALTTFAVAAAGAIAAACTVVGIPAAIGAVAGGLTVVIGIIGAAVMALESHTNTIETEQNAIMQKIHDIGREWTMPVVGSDWEAGR